MPDKGLESSQHDSFTWGEGRGGGQEGEEQLQAKWSL